MWHVDAHGWLTKAPRTTNHRLPYVSTLSYGMTCHSIMGFYEAYYESSSSIKRALLNRQRLLFHLCHCDTKYGQGAIFQNDCSKVQRKVQRSEQNSLRHGNAYACQWTDQRWFTKLLGTGPVTNLHIKLWLVAVHLIHSNKILQKLCRKTIQSLSKKWSFSPPLGLDWCAIICRNHYVSWDRGFCRVGSPTCWPNLANSDHQGRHRSLLTRAVCSMVDMVLKYINEYLQMTCW